MEWDKNSWEKGILSRGHKGKSVSDTLEEQEGEPCCWGKVNHEEKRAKVKALGRITQALVG